MTPSDEHPLLRHASPEVAEAVAERLGHPPAAPPDAEPQPTPESPEAAIARLRSGRGKDPRYVLDGVAVADWDLILREHHRAPLPDSIAAALVARDDCPPDAALALVVCTSTSRRGLATMTLTAALARGAVTPRQVMTEAAPGWSALRTLDKYSRRYGERLVPLDAVFAEAAALLPGDDLEAWLWLIEHGPHHPGPFPQLCADTRLPPDRRPDVPTGRAVHWDFGNPAALLARTPPRTAARVIAALTPTAVSGLLETPRLPPSVVIRALRRAPDLTGSLVRAADRAPASVARLLALHDPEVNSALLVHHPRVDVALAVFAATRRDAPRTVPLAPRARQELLYGPDQPLRRAAAAMHGHYPQLIRGAISRYGTLLGTAGLLRGCLSIWECQGPGALRDPELTASLGPEAGRAVAEALAAADGVDGTIGGHGVDPHGTGLALLRAAVAHHERPDVLLDAIRRSPDLASLPVPPGFWPAAAEAHARMPLPSRVLTRFVEHPDCPDGLALDACAQLPDLADTLGGRSRAFALTAARHPLPQAEYFGVSARNSWYLTALALGHLHPEEFVELTHPAAHVLGNLGELRPTLPEAWQAATAHVARLLTDVLGDDLEAWTVAAHLLPDFAGSLPELLDTVKAVTA
ncbi:hypothetical protein [Yinghuangia seranimata]|uniref:hypothetical protein n=1 Tax=Yinghuangia seranimata TaxID=408067 RepID=UPI00248AD649|nr:hypothetical protein [Yinghuangia seranimata]MDI2127819.1 hypothetical protein [Yinghuangia seranimata]